MGVRFQNGTGLSKRLRIALDPDLASATAGVRYLLISKHHTALRYSPADRRNAWFSLVPDLWSGACTQ